jgi:hypothetical protein
MNEVVFIARVGIWMWVPKYVPIYPEGTDRAAKEIQQSAADDMHRALWQELPERFTWEQILGNIAPTGQTR